MPRKGIITDVFPRSFVVQFPKKQEAFMNIFLDSENEAKLKEGAVASLDVKQDKLKIVESKVK